MVPSWSVGAAANALIGACYLVIAASIARGLVRTQQTTRNPLGLATAAIFLSCGVGHGLHSAHLLVPMGGHTDGMRMAWTWEMALWDALTACVALTYLWLRPRYGQLLSIPEMFRDEVERSRAQQLDELVRALPDAVLVLDADGAVERVNAAADAAGLAATVDRPHVREAIGAVAFAPDERRVVEVLVGGPDGDRCWSARVAGLPTPGGGPHRVVVSFADVTDLRRLADHDALTGLLNRRGFSAVLERHLAACERYGPSGALVLLDLDGFKQVNDRLGHQEGDAVLRAAADALRGRVRASDALGRLGGDELAVLLLRADADDARAAAAGMVEALALRRTGRGVDVGVGASAGVAAIRPGDTADRLFAAADRALYRAKADGGGRALLAAREAVEGR